MSKVTATNNGDSGATARSNWNQAVKEVESTDFAAGVFLDDDTMAADSATAVASQQSIKAYVDSTTMSIPSVKSYTYKSKASNGVEFLAGFYEANSTDANLDEGSLTVTFGTANVAYAAHAFVVMAAAGATDGSDLVLTVTGTSITDAGVRTGADSEVIVVDGTAVSTDQYLETSKKWLGTVTFTLSSTGGTTYNLDFNYGIAKYDDIGNVPFQITGVEIVGEASANDTGFNVQVLIHDGTGWTYAATGFLPGGTVLIDMNVDHGAESDLSNNEYFSYKRTGLSTNLDGSASEGFIYKVTTSANNAVDYMDAHMKFLFT